MSFHSSNSTKLSFWLLTNDIIFQNIIKAGFFGEEKIPLVFAGFAIRGIFLEPNPRE